MKRLLIAIAIMTSGWAGAQQLERDIAACQRQCLSFCESLSRQLSRTADNIAYTCGVPSYPQPQPNPPPVYGGDVSVYASASCRNLVGTVQPATDCRAFGLRNNSWIYSVYIEGSCYNSSPLQSEQACLRFRTAKRTDVMLFTSSNCQNVAAAVHPGTQCRGLAGNEWIYSIRNRFGQCLNVQVGSLQNACENFKNN